MSHVRRPAALLLAAILAASWNACGDAQAPTEPSLATVKVTAVTTTLVPGQSTQHVARAATAAFTWLSEAPAVAAVEATGRVTAVSPGTALIAASAPR